MYIIEGNIGAGKSTFLQAIKRNVPDLSIGLEPLEQWHKQIYGQSLLAQFYEDQQRWSYSLETLTMMSRVKEHLIHQKNIVTHLVERSIYSGHYCFTKNGYEQGAMSSLEWAIYNEWFTFLIPGKCHPPKGFIYLRVTPEVAYERIKNRNRPGEANIPLSYLKQIHEKHEQFLIEKKDVLPELQKVPVLILDCNNEFETDTAQLQDHINRVLSFTTHR